MPAPVQGGNDDAPVSLGGTVVVDLVLGRPVKVELELTK
jgi:hypothetical protein